MEYHVENAKSNPQIKLWTGGTHGSVTIELFESSVGTYDLHKKLNTAHSLATLSTWSLEPGAWFRTTNTTRCVF